MQTISFYEVFRTFVHALLEMRLNLDTIHNEYGHHGNYNHWFNIGNPTLGVFI